MNNLSAEKVLAFAALALLVGCDSETPQPPKPIELEKIRTDIITYDIPFSWAYEFRLKDGTRCVYLRSDGGITCDWNGEKHAVE